MEDTGKKINCPKCEWSWRFDSSQNDAYMCHKCGFDIMKNDFDFDSFEDYLTTEPYSDKSMDDMVVRTFKKDVNPNELVWHTDREDRFVKPLEPTNWMIQMDNKLPMTMNEGVFIPKGVYHRLIKGDGDLKITINEQKKSSYFRRVPLPYDYDSLKKFVGEETMWEHYNKHYMSYTKKLNEALSKLKTSDNDIESIIRNINKYNQNVRNNAGGYFNHSLFWNYLSPKKTKPSEELENKIIKDFGSMDKFKKLFTEESLKVFGSGWCWLVMKNGKLKVVTTPNQDNPLMEKMGDPILGLDVWEHAYYLNYKSDRKDYINNFWKVVNWDDCSQTFNFLNSK